MGLINRWRRQRQFREARARMLGEIDAVLQAQQTQALDAAKARVYEREQARQTPPAERPLAEKVLAGDAHVLGVNKDRGTVLVAERVDPRASGLGYSEVDAARIDRNHREMRRQAAEDGCGVTFGRQVAGGAKRTRVAGSAKDPSDRTNGTPASDRCPYDHDGDGTCAWHDQSCALDGQAQAAAPETVVGPTTRVEGHDGRRFPKVRGRCPACDSESLVLGAGGHVTCSLIGCRAPLLANTLIHEHRLDTPCCGQFGDCDRACVPRGQWQERQRLSGCTLDDDGNIVDQAKATPSEVLPPGAVWRVGQDRPDDRAPDWGRCECGSADGVWWYNESQGRAWIHRRDNGSGDRFAVYCAQHGPNTPPGDTVDDGAVPEPAEVAAVMRAGVCDSVELLGQRVLYRTDGRGGKMYDLPAIVTCVQRTHVDLPALRAMQERGEIEYDAAKLDGQPIPLVMVGNDALNEGWSTDHGGIYVPGNPLPIPHDGAVHLVVTTPGEQMHYRELSVPYDPTGQTPRSWRFHDNGGPF